MVVVEVGRWESDCPERSTGFVTRSYGLLLNVPKLHLSSQNWKGMGNREIKCIPKLKWAPISKCIHFLSLLEQVTATLVNSNSTNLLSTVIKVTSPAQVCWAVIKVWAGLHSSPEALALGENPFPCLSSFQILPYSWTLGPLPLPSAPTRGVSLWPFFYPGSPISLRPRPEGSLTLKTHVIRLSTSGLIQDNLSISKPLT